MLEKLQLKKEWKLSPNIIRNYYGGVIYGQLMVTITDDKCKHDVILPKGERIFLTSSDFYGFANRSRLEYAHIIPNELLEFKISSCLDFNIKNEVSIKKINSNQYEVKIYSEKYESRYVSSPEVNIKETLNEEMMKEKLALIPDVFEAYPFLILPFGNCFDS